jgi:hypothetical protein
MRKVAHRILSSFPMLAVAILALMAAANPKGAEIRLNGFIELMRDQRFLWLCMLILAAYFLLWWVTSIEPTPRRNIVQRGLRRQHLDLTQVQNQLSAAADDAEFEVSMERLQEALNRTADWINFNMDAAAIEMFKAPSRNASSFAWPSNPGSALAGKRSDVLGLNAARLKVLETFLKHDGWDGPKPKMRERIKRWKATT